MIDQTLGLLGTARNLAEQAEISDGGSALAQARFVDNGTNLLKVPKDMAVRSGEHK